MRHSDTSLEAEKVYLEMLRGMTDEQRSRIAFDLTNFMRRAAASRIQSEHPDWTERQIKRELLRISLLPDPLPPDLLWLATRTIPCDTSSVRWNAPVFPTCTSTRSIAGDSVFLT